MEEKSFSVGEIVMEQSDIKSIKRGRDEFKRYQKIIDFLGGVLSCFPKGVRNFAFNFCRNISGKKGMAIRYLFLKSLAQECGKNVAVFEGVYLKNLSQIKFGDNISIHSMCYIEGAGGITIGNDVSIANGTTLVSTEHNYSNIKIPIKDQGVKLSPIIIEDDVWIGSRAVVLSGNKIKKGCIIGAGAVVTKSTEEYSIYAGVPAVRIKNRKKL